MTIVNAMILFYNKQGIKGVKKMNYLVFDIGGTFVKYALIDDQGHISHKNKIPSLKTGIDDFIDSLVQVYQEYKVYDLSGIAISVPGAVDVEKGIIYHGGGLPFLHECCITEVLSKRCDNLNVAVENDGKCAGLAEVWLGNASDVKDAVCMVIGSGIGGAIIKDRKIIRGNRLIAGEISNIIVDYTREQLEQGKSPLSNTYAFKASAILLTMRVAKLKGLDPKEVTGEKVYEWANQGDEICINALEDVYFNIAMQAYNFQYTYDPDVILIGGGISEQPQFIEGIKRYVERIGNFEYHFAHPIIKPCKYNNDSNLLGALYNFKQIYE